MDGIFTTTSLYSLGAVAALGLVAVQSANTFLPKTTSSKDRATFIWLAFDAMIHTSFEGSFLYLSVFGRQVNTSEGMFASMCKYTLFPIH
jgi:hypothetical protein